MDKELLEQYGIDYEKGLTNCMGDEKLFARLLSMFLKDECFPRAEEAFERGDYNEVFSCLHELKGASGNAALVVLYDSISPVVDMLRGGSSGDKEKVESLEKLFLVAKVAYKNTHEGVALILANA